MCPGLLSTALINTVSKKCSLRGKEFISFKFYSLNVFHSTYADIPNFLLGSSHRLYFRQFKQGRYAANLVTHADGD